MRIYRIRTFSRNSIRRQRETLRAIEKPPHAGGGFSLRYFTMKSVSNMQFSFQNRLMRGAVFRCAFLPMKSTSNIQFSFQAIRPYLLEQVSFLKTGSKEATHRLRIGEPADLHAVFRVL
jgi:hypothetical protein